MTPLHTLKKLNNHSDQYKNPEIIIAMQMIMTMSYSELHDVKIDDRPIE